MNEGPFIARLLERLLSHANEHTEIIVVDGGSTDTTLSILKCNQVKYIETRASKASQMNKGASEACGNVLYFVHADTLPPVTYYHDIKKAIESGKESGCYRFRFESDKWQLKLNAFFAKNKILPTRSGDQSLFVKTDVFEELGGFDDSMAIMAEYPLIEKLMERNSFKVLEKNIIVPARRYENVTWRQVSSANAAALKLYRKGKDSEVIRNIYHRLIRPKQKKP